MNVKLAKPHHLLALLCSVYLLLPSAANPLLDTSFNPPLLQTFFGQTNLTLSVTSTVTQPDGNIIVAAAGHSPISPQHDRGVVFRLQTNGALDSSFPISHFDGAVRSLALDKDGNLFVGGNFNLVGDVSKPGFARFDPNGTLDPAFPQGSGVEPANTHPLVNALALDSEGNLLVGGYFRQVSGVAISSLARILPDGGVDSTFTPFDPLLESSPLISALIVLPNDRVLVVGDWASVNENHIAIFLPNGASDPSFTPTLAESLHIHSAAAQPDGKFLIGTSQGVFRLLPNGQVDLSFSSEFRASGLVFVLRKSDGSIVIGGEFSAVQGAVRGGVAQLFPDGTLDVGFDPGKGLYRNLSSDEAVAYVYTLSSQADGKILVGGSFTHFDSIPAPDLVRLHLPPLSTDTRIYFESPSHFPENSGLARVKITRIGDISYPLSVDLLAVDQSAINGRDFSLTPPTISFPPGLRAQEIPFTLLDNSALDSTRTFLLQLTNASVITALDSGSNSLQISIHDDEIRVEMASSSLAISEGERILRVPVNVFADSFVYGLVPRTFELSFLTKNSTALSGRDYTISNQAALFSTVNHPVIQQSLSNSFTFEILDNRLVDGSRAFTIELQQPPPGIFLGAKKSASITILDNDHLAGHALGANAKIRALASHPPARVLVGGDFTFFDGLPRPFLARVHLDGTLDESFVPAPFNDSIDEIFVQPDGKILVAGEFTSVGPTPMNHLARLHPDGSLDSSFTIGSGWTERVGPPHLWALASGPGGEVYAGSSYNRFNGELRPALVRLLPDGSFDQAFTPVLSLAPLPSAGGIHDLALHPNGSLLIAGLFRVQFTPESQPISALASLFPNGNLERIFVQGYPPVSQIALTPDSAIFALRPKTTSYSYSTLVGYNTNGMVSFSRSFSQPPDTLLALPNNQVLLSGEVIPPYKSALLLLDSTGAELAVRPLSSTLAEKLILLPDQTIMAAMVGPGTPPLHHLALFTTDLAPLENLRFLPLVRTADRKTHLALRGQSAQSYSIERSTNLLNWQLIHINTTPFIPPTLTDEPAPNAPAIFYRVRR